MKIRNKHCEAEINSPNILEEKTFFSLSLVNNHMDYGFHCFYKNDGWEEVKEGLSTRITSLSEEQKTSIINILRDTLTTWVHEGVIDMIVDVFEPRLSELNLWK